jgi:pimeloyl-ACP methyl ester carboxylesterase
VDVRGQVVTMLDRSYLASAMPTLLVWGARDRILPVRHARLAHAAMPGSRLEVFRTAGHFPHLSEPGRFVALLNDFIETSSPAKHDPGAWRAMLRDGGVTPAMSSGS